jgi:hypothetical protein
MSDYIYRWNHRVVPDEPRTAQYVAADALGEGVEVSIDGVRLVVVNAFHMPDGRWSHYLREVTAPARD